MKLKILAASFVLLLLAGCATDPLSDAQVEAMHKPTIAMTCHTKCTLDYTDPRDRPGTPTNRNDVILGITDQLTRAVTGVAPWAAVGVIATEGIKNAVGDNNSDNSIVNTNIDESSRDDRVDNSTRDNRVDNSYRDNSSRDNSTRDNRVDNSSRDNRSVPVESTSEE